MVVEQKTISKSELGLRYFPHLSKYWARTKLIEYLNECENWHPGKNFKRRRYFTLSEVKLVEKIMG